MPSAILRFLTDTTLDGCAMACLSDQACLSFAHDVTSSLCQLYLVTDDGTNSVAQTGPVYYEKFQAMVSFESVCLVVGLTVVKVKTILKESPYCTTLNRRGVE